MRSTVGRGDVIHVDLVTNPGSESSSVAGRLAASAATEPAAAPLTVLVIDATTVTSDGCDDVGGVGVGLLGEPPQAAVTSSTARAATRRGWRRITLQARQRKRVGWVTGLEPATS